MGPASKAWLASFRPVRLVLVSLFALTLGWLIVAVGVASANRTVRPDLALSMLDFDSRSKGRLAEQMLTDAQQASAARAQARALATSALLRDPTVMSAWHTLALLTAVDGQEQRASQMFHAAERLSRRDLPIQLWLIEDRVRQDDIRGALRHYDIALRTSTRSWDLLFPVLIAATREDAVTNELGGLLTSNPPWRAHFLTRFVEAPPSGPNAARLITRLAASHEFPDREIAARVLPALIERGDIAPAQAVYRSLAGADAADAPLRHGSSFGPNPFPPIDWSLTDEVGFSARAQPMSEAEGGQALELQGASGRAGTIARQLLMLSPGTYRLQWRAGRAETAAPAQLHWLIICADQRQIRIGQADISATSPRLQAQAMTFTVPAGCAAQWLNVIMDADFGPSGTQAWIANVRLSRS